MSAKNGKREARASFEAPRFPPGDFNPIVHFAILRPIAPCRIRTCHERGLSGRRRLSDNHPTVLSKSGRPVGVKVCRSAECFAVSIRENGCYSDIYSFFLDLTYLITSFQAIRHRAYLAQLSTSCDPQYRERAPSEDAPILNLGPQFHNEALGKLKGCKTKLGQCVKVARRFDN